MTRHYEIRDYSHNPGWVEFITDYSTSIEDAYTSSLPIDPVEREKFKEPSQPKKFAKRSEAVLYLDVLRAYRSQDWENNQHSYRTHGRQKPAWKIYPVDSE